MAIALVASSANVSAVDGEVTAGPINTTGATLLVMMEVSRADQDGTKSDSAGNTWTLLTRQVGGGGNPALNVWYVDTSPLTSATHSFTTGVTTLSQSAIGVMAFSGTLAGGADDWRGDVNSSTSITSSAMTPTQDNDVVMAFLGTQGDGTPSQTSGGFTVLDSAGFNSGHWFGIAQAYLIQTVAANAQITWDVSSGNSLASVTFCVKAATGGSTVKAAGRGGLFMGIGR